MALFRIFLGLYSTKYMKFSPQLVLKQKKSMFRPSLYFDKNCYPWPGSKGQEKAYKIEIFSQFEHAKFHSLPSKHLLVFKTSSRDVLKTSSTRLQRNSLEDVLKTFCKYVLKMSWKTKNCYAVLKTS